MSDSHLLQKKVNRCFDLWSISVRTVDFACVILPLSGRSFPRWRQIIRYYPTMSFQNVNEVYYVTVLLKLLLLDHYTTKCLLNRICKYCAIFTIFCNEEMQIAAFIISSDVLSFKCFPPMLIRGIFSAALELRD